MKILVLALLLLTSNILNAQIELYKDGTVDITTYLTRIESIEPDRSEIKLGRGWIQHTVYQSYRVIIFYDVVERSTIRLKTIMLLKYGHKTILCFL